MSQTYTPEEWRLVSKVMDTVETLRRSSSTPVDVEKVKALVLKTYESHGEAISPGLIDQAIAVATDNFSLAATHHRHWWDQPTVDYWEYQRLPEVEKAKHCLQVLKNHRLYSHSELRALLVNAAEQARAAETLADKTTWRRVGRGTLGMVLVGLPALLLLFPWKLALIFGVLGLIGILLVLAALQPASTQNHVREAMDALKLFDNKQYKDQQINRIFQKLMNTQGLPFGFDMAEITEPDAFEWRWAQQAAEVHPAVAEVWKQWLASERPFRESDYSLIRTTANAIEEAREAMKPPKLVLTGEEIRHRKALLRKLT